MRFIDSKTLTTSDELGNSVLNCPVLTKPWESVEFAIFVGVAATLIIDAGAIELPPEMLESVPIKSSKAPRAPTCQMPYIGLWGFVLVSLLDSAGISVPLVLAIAAALARVLMPRNCALSE